MPNHGIHLTNLLNASCSFYCELERTAGVVLYLSLGFAPRRASPKAKDGASRGDPGGARSAGRSSSNPRSGGCYPITFYKITFMAKIILRRPWVAARRAHTMGGPNHYPFINHHPPNRKVHLQRETDDSACRALSFRYFPFKAWKNPSRSGMLK
jgi:hypothetical protein